MITLKTLKDATQEQIIAQAKEHLLKQNEKSVDIKGDCAYRGVNGLMCVAGCFIADDEYSPGIEGGSWVRLIQLSMAPQTHSQLMLDLQKIHDSFLPCFWKEELDKLEKQYLVNV